MSRVVVTIPTSLGEAEARPDGVGIWLLSTPWGDRRFAGNRAQAAAELRRMIAEQDEEEEE